MRESAGQQVSDGGPFWDTLGRPLPFARSYWVSYPVLLAGCLPGDEDLPSSTTKLRGLLSVGIRFIVNLMEADERDDSGRPFTPYDDVLAEMAAESGSQAVAERFPIPDLDVPSPGRMSEILDAIDRGIAGHRPTYVHCRGGTGRTGTVVGCWLARHGVARGRESLRRLRDLRAAAGLIGPDSPETGTQRRMVETWQPGA